MLKAENILSKKYLVLIFFAVIGAALFASTINVPFHLDDFRSIADNKEVHIDDLSFKTLKKAAFTHEAGLRPLSYLSFALNYYISGPDVTTSYHVVNIVIHIINAFLIYLVILQMFDYDSADDAGKERLAVAALFTALIWLVTPLNSQVVINIVQRMTSMMTLFFLSAFLCYLIAKKSKRPGFFILSFLLFILAILAKENAITLIPVILMYEFVLVKKAEVHSVTKREKVFLILLLLVFLMPLFLYLEAIIAQFSIGGKMYGLTLSERFLSQSRVIIFYLSLIVMPLPGRLSVTHYIVKSTSLFTPVSTALSMLLVIMIIALAVVRIKKSPYLSFALLWFFITLSIVLVMPIEIFPYEYRIYMPSIFLFGVFVKSIVDRFYDNSKMKALAAFIALSILLSVFTYIRGNVWASGVTLWADTVEKYPEDARALNNLSNELKGEEQYELALEYAQKAIGYSGEWDLARYNLARIYFFMGDHDNAIIAFEAALKLNPHFRKALFGMAETYRSKRDYTNTERYYKKIVADGDKENDDYFDRALHNLGALYIATKRYSLAEDTLNDLIKRAPKSGAAHYNLGTALQGQRKNAEAAEEYKLAIKYGYDKEKATKRLKRVSK